MQSSKLNVSKQVRSNRSKAIHRAAEIQPLESRRLLSATITVNTFTDRTDAVSSTIISLRDAVTRASAANTSETINLPAGTYTLTLGRLELTGGTVTVQPVSGTPIISGGNTSGVFKVDGTATAVFTGLNITNGKNASSAGGIDNEGNLTLNSCTVTNNTVTSNTGTGGGIVNNDSLTVNSSTVSNNFIGTTAAATNGLGGGIYNGFDGGVTITKSTISNNTAGTGGGIYNSGGSACGITASTVSGNKAAALGGGVFNSGPFTAQNDTLFGNTTNGSGGAMYDAGTSSLINCTITNNTATYISSGGGGGVYSLGVTSVGNSVIAKNTVAAPASVAMIGTDYQGPVSTLGYNVIGIGDDDANTTRTFIGQMGDQLGTTASPIDPELSAPTSTSPSVEIPMGVSALLIPELDFAGSYPTSSPLIDQGNNALATSATDERGQARIVNGAVDIGAVETQITVSPMATALNVAPDQTITYALGTFTDPGSAGPYNVLIDYVDEEAGDTTTVSTTGSLGTINDSYSVDRSGFVLVTDGNGTIGVSSTEFEVDTFESAPQLTGTTIGTAGSYQNDGNTISKATDSNLTTFFDAPTAGTSAANDNWVGYDYGSSGAVVTGVAFASRLGWESRMNGGMIQASNSATFASATTIYTIPSNSNPPSNNQTYLDLANTTNYRYYRYLSPNGSYGDIAELQFFGHPGTITIQPTQLTGTTIGTTGSYQNDGNTITKATDGNLSTFFDAPTANGNWVGIDLGTTGGVATQVKFASRALFTSRMNGGTIQASNSPTFASGVVTLYTIASNANVPSGSLTTVNLSNTTAYRYYRYLSPNGSYGDIAEIQFFGTPGGLATVFSGTTIGTAGSYQNDGNTITKATDGNLSTFFDGATANGNWVGLDLGTAQVVNEVAYASRSGWVSRLNGGMIQASNTADFSSGVVTLYTIGASANPPAGSLTTTQFTNTTAYRYYRYLSPNGSFGNIAELEFLSTM